MTNYWKELGLPVWTALCKSKSRAIRIKGLQFSNLVLAATFLAGCASIIDPAPYRPEADKDIAIQPPAKYTPVELTTFNDLVDAETKLETLSLAYAGTRDNLMRQQLAFDLPMLGLAVATIANGIYRGDKDVTLGLGLGSATLAGGRAYLSPQTRILAYSGAAASLACGAGVADVMSGIKDSQAESLSITLAHLTTALDWADTAVETKKFGENLSDVDSAALIKARDQARKARDDLASALDTLGNAHRHLATFARNVENDATTRIVTGSQNLDAAMALIKATPTSIPTVPAQAPNKAGFGAGLFQPANVQGLTDLLQQFSTTGEAASKQITDAWAVLLTCALPKS